MGSWALPRRGTQTESARLPRSAWDRWRRHLPVESSLESRGARLRSVWAGEVPRLRSGGPGASTYCHPARPAAASPPRREMEPAVRFCWLARPSRFIYSSAGVAASSPALLHLPARYLGLYTVQSQKKRRSSQHRRGWGSKSIKPPGNYPSRYTLCSTGLAGGKRASCAP